MTTKTSQPDWDSIAEKFDILMPQLAPVGEALLDALNVVPGDRVLDIASGTGEPALTLARRQPQAEIVGTDTAGGMVRAAQKKVDAEGLGNITFHRMAAEQLNFPDRSFDKALCRFGVMLFEDPLQGCREIRRVLKPGGTFAFSVWSVPEMMTTMYWAVQVFRDRVPAENQPAIDKVASLGAPGAFDALLRAAGFSEFTVTPFRFNHEYPSFDAYWDAAEASDILKQQFDVLPIEERAQVREKFANLAREFQTGNGLVIPHECLLAVGSR